MEEKTCICCGQPVTPLQRLRYALEKNDIDPDAPVLKCTNAEALSNLQECLEALGVEFDLTELDKLELKQLLGHYASAISTYHPEDWHQERGALMEMSETLKHHGLSQTSIDELDFS